MNDSLLRFREDVLQKLNIKKEVLEAILSQEDNTDLLKSLYKSKLVMVEEIIEDIKGIEVDEYDY